MSYLSIEFAVVFILFFLLYWLFRRSVAIQNGLLLVASYWIIGLFSVDFALILGGYTTVIYLLSTGIIYGRSPKFWLISAIVVGVGNLALFKY
ncbi:MBOAT family protein, partial [Tsukamurella asaccharolytica]